MEGSIGRCPHRMDLCRCRYRFRHSGWGTSWLVKPRENGCRQPLRNRWLPIGWVPGRPAATQRSTVKRGCSGGTHHSAPGAHRLGARPWTRRLCGLCSPPRRQFWAVRGNGFQRVQPLAGLIRRRPARSKYVASHAIRSPSSDSPAQASFTRMEWKPSAPFGATDTGSSDCKAPIRSVARTLMTWFPGSALLASQTWLH